jgi:hypothetical protein
MGTPTVNVAGRYRHPQTGEDVIVSESTRNPGQFIAGLARLANGSKPPYERGLIYKLSPQDLIAAGPVAAVPQPPVDQFVLDGGELLVEVKALRAELAELRALLRGESAA